jgi:hypothetical protein
MLLENRKIVAGGVLAGTVLNNYLQWMCARRDLKLGKKEQTLTAMNDILYKFQTYYHPTYIRMQGLIPIAEACLDPQKKNPSKKQIKGLISGVNKVLGAES